jgi:hypothetical protein
MNLSEPILTGILLMTLLFMAITDALPLTSGGKNNAEVGGNVLLVELSSSDKLPDHKNLEEMNNDNTYLRSPSRRGKRYSFCY